jgi:hypothetical protein
VFILARESALRGWERQMSASACAVREATVTRGASCVCERRTSGGSERNCVQVYNIAMIPITCALCISCNDNPLVRHAHGHKA